MNINGINNFIKLKNKNYCLNILTFTPNIDYYSICDNNNENIDIQTYLFNKLHNTNDIYNFFLPNFDNLNENKKYNYYNEIIKLQNKNELLKNINFINYNYILKEYTEFITFINNYNNFLYFNRKTILDFINDLKLIINKLNIMFTNNNKIPKKISTQTRIILEYIYINYFKNKISSIIYDSSELIKFCELHHNKFKQYLNFTNEYYDTVKHVYKINHKICTNLTFLLNFINVFDIILQIFIEKNTNNILYISNNISNLIIYLLITNFNFEIIIISYSDKLIDNENIITTNKIIKNIDIYNESTIDFLANYLTNYEYCITLDNNDLFC